MKKVVRLSRITNTTKSEPVVFGLALFLSVESRSPRYKNKKISPHSAVIYLK